MIRIPDDRTMFAVSIPGVPWLVHTTHAKYLTLGGTEEEWDRLNKTKAVDIPHNYPTIL